MICGNYRESNTTGFSVAWEIPAFAHRSSVQGALLRGAFDFSWAYTLRAVHSTQLSGSDCQRLGWGRGRDPRGYLFNSPVVQMGRWRPRTWVTGPLSWHPELGWTKGHSLSSKMWVGRFPQGLQGGRKGA